MMRNIRKASRTDSEQKKLDSTASPSSLDLRVGDSWIHIFKHHQMFGKIFFNSIGSPCFQDGHDRQNLHGQNCGHGASMF